MPEKCKTCKNEFNSGIWMSPQFQDEKVLLFCSEKCRQDYINKKLERIRWKYPAYYKKLIKQPQNKEDYFEFDVNKINKRNESLGKKHKQSVAVPKRLVR